MSPTSLIVYVYMMEYLVILGVLLYVPLSGAMNTPCSSTPELFALTEQDYPTGKDGQTVWSQCNYPNPRKQWSACGQSKSSWICDPDHLLSKKDMIEVKAALNYSIKHSICHCPNKQCEDSYGHEIYIILAKSISVTNLMGSVCTHQVMPGVCADTFPKLHPTGRLPTKREKDLAVNEFAETYYKNVRAGICGNSLVFLYVEKISSYAIYAGHITQEVLGEKLETVPRDISKYIEDGKIKMALLELLKGFSDLQETTSWPVIVGFTLVGIVGLIIILGCVVTVIFIIRQRQEGKDWYEVCIALQGGYEAVLFGRRHGRQRDVKSQQALDENIPMEAEA